MIIYPYRIEECGFYKRGAESPEFGNPRQFLPDFVEWIRSRESVVSTATFRDKENTVPRVLCLEAFSNKNEQEYGIVLWNESPQHDEGVLSIPIESKVGDVTATATEMPGQSIPGWPTYLWIDTKNSLVVSLVPNNMRGSRSSGIKQARKYFEKYLKLKSPYVKTSRIKEDLDSVEEKVIGWQENKTIDSEDYFIRFKTRELKTVGNLDRIREDHTNIYKIISKSSLRTEIPIENNLLNNVTRFLKMDINRRPHDTITFKAEIDWQPSLENLNSLIDEWEDKINEEEVDYEIGVKFNRESAKIYWFNQSRGRFEFEISSELEQEYLWTEKEIKEVWSLVSYRVIDINTRSIS